MSTDEDVAEFHRPASRNRRIAGAVARPGRRLRRPPSGGWERLGRLAVAEPDALRPGGDRVTYDDLRGWRTDSVRPHVSFWASGVDECVHLFDVGGLRPYQSSSSPADVAYSLGHFPAVPAGPLPASTNAALQAVLDAAVQDLLPGVTATVLVAGHGAWSGAAGTTEGVHQVKVSSQFGIASITKTVIAAEIMRLSEQGLLRLSDPVSAHLPPNFHFDTNGATIENLLSMESGIPDPVFTPPTQGGAGLRRERTPQEVLASVPTYRSTPGDSFVYGDANYMLLGLVIAKTTGTSVAAALRSHILADPRLSSLVYQPEERPKGPLAYRSSEGRFDRTSSRPAAATCRARQEPAREWSGCMASDSGALALWTYLLFGRHLLSEPSLLAMTDFAKNDPHDHYGLGVFDVNPDLIAAVGGTGFGVQAIGNGGWEDGGYSSTTAVLPSKGVVISVLTNTAGDPRSLVLPLAAEALLHAPHVKQRSDLGPSGSSTNISTQRTIALGKRPGRTRLLVSLTSPSPPNTARRLSTRPERTHLPLSARARRIPGLTYDLADIEADERGRSVGHVAQHVEGRCPASAKASSRLRLTQDDAPSNRRVEGALKETRAARPGPVRQRRRGCRRRSARAPSLGW